MATAGRSSLVARGATALVNVHNKLGAGANGNVPAQQLGSTPPPSPNGAPNSSIPIGAGPGGRGGAAIAAFDSLNDLIVSTVAHETWAENGGGMAEIRP